MPKVIHEYLYRYVLIREVEYKLSTSTFFVPVIFNSNCSMVAIPIVYFISLIGLISKISLVAI